MVRTLNLEAQLGDSWVIGKVGRDQICECCPKKATRTEWVQIQRKQKRQFYGITFTYKTNRKQILSHVGLKEDYNINEC